MDASPSRILWRSSGRKRAYIWKADPQTSAKVIVKLFNKVWEDEKVLDTRKKGIIVNLPKKGNLSECGNWRGINLLSTSGKIYRTSTAHEARHRENPTRRTVRV